MMVAMYPPKFWSNDFLIPGYTGTVTSISLMYTTIRTTDNVMLKLPNNIMIQAAILTHNEEYRLVMIKYEIRKNSIPEVAIRRIEEDLKDLDFITGSANCKSPRYNAVNLYNCHRLHV